MFECRIENNDPLDDKLTDAYRRHLDKDTLIKVVSLPGDARGEVYAVEIAFYLRREGYEAEWIARPRETPHPIGVKIVSRSEVWVGSE